MLIDPDSYGISGIPKWLATCIPKAPLSFVLIYKDAPIQYPEEKLDSSLDHLTVLSLINEMVDMKEGSEQAAEHIFRVVLANFLAKDTSSEATK